MKAARARKPFSFCATVSDDGRERGVHGCGRTHGKLVPLVKTAFAGLLLETHGDDRLGVEDGREDGVRGGEGFGILREEFAFGLDVFYRPLRW